MRSITLTFCAAAVVAATLVPASAALADSDSGPAQEKGRESSASLTATPSSVAPGGEVDLRLEGCEGREATGESDVFVSEARFSPAAGGGLFAEARISSDATPGDYDIRVACKDDKDAEAAGTVTVVDRGRATPLAPVPAGGGGTALLADREARQEGPGTVHAVIGLALAAVAAVAVAFRSARRRRPASD
ncbi:hypothetical protein OG978_15210 [Streptomyces sp. NBC_01591]|uniref:hypothetical protein n=1 Tax=Streptomyces sp. NBC_01591 TaxID=2975888 RepID=UPI002DDAD248|nr:hypothetical protein [Streptomyces sp. NBC_01591]WSD68630.1 hypothetical protein OG978_15210 [Streptomyces sp. NBC_01591]